jgi:hypothetical protein
MGSLYFNFDGEIWFPLLIRRSGREEKIDESTLGPVGALSAFIIELWLAIKAS